MADLREDFRAFAATVGCDLWPHQVEAASSEAFVTVIAAARRTGKTTLIELLAMWTAMRDSGSVIVVLSATQDASRRVTESIGDRLAGNALTRGAVVDDGVSRIRLKNGSEVVSLPASQRQVRGYGRGVRLLVIDEAGFVPDELWRAAWPIALDERRRGSRIILAGTPWGGGFFRDAFRAGVNGDPDYDSRQWSYKVNKQLDHKYLERQRDRIAPGEYAAEVLGEWSDAAGSLFARDLLEAQTADLVVPLMSELDGEAQPLLGFDHGVSFDQSALAAIYRLPDLGLNPDAEKLPRFVAWPYTWPQATALSQTVRDVAAIPARSYAISTETVGVGSGPSQALSETLREQRHEPRMWNFVATTAAKKTAGYGAILALLERGQLILPREPSLLRQLAGLRFEHGERGFTKIGAEDAAVHDDVADALMLATAPHVPQGAKRVQTQLMTLAGARAVPDAELDPLDCAVTETGSGLRLYERPAVQSVAGMEITLPSGVRSTPPPKPVDRRGRFTFTERK